MSIRPEQTIALWETVGLTANFSPDRAVRYDLKGNPIETLAEALRCGEAFPIVPLTERDQVIDFKSIYSVYVNKSVLETFSVEEQAYALTRNDAR